jgi:hypothetical protein
MASRAVRRPAGRITEVFDNAAQRQGAYGLLESDAVSADGLAGAMFVACARRAANEPFVFCPVDGTSLTLTDDARTKDFGSVGARSKGARGLKVINALVLSPTGVPIGISAQEWWTRPPTRRKKHREQLPPEKKEIGRWLAAMEKTRAIMAKHAPKTRCWFQLDREGDAWPVLLQAGTEAHWFTIRASWNRRVESPDPKHTYLRDLLSVQPVRTTYALPVRAAKSRTARLANMEVRACSVTLSLKDKRTRKRRPLTVNVVHAVEQGTTPPGEPPIEWLLLTNRPIETTEHLHQIVFGYSMRWRIEELHRTWKSGACRVEETQLRSTAAVIKWATILIAVAVRVDRLKLLSRQEPDRPATDEFSPVEIQAIVLLRFEGDGKRRPPKGAVPTLAQATRWVAELGGYAGSRSSPPPGSVTIARGLKDVRAAVRALEALARTQ